MPKRKHLDQDVEELSRKLKEIEKKLRLREKTVKRRRVQVFSSSSDSSRSSPVRGSHTQDNQAENHVESERGPVDAATSSIGELIATVASTSSAPTEPLDVPPGEVPSSSLPLDDDIREILGLDPTDTTAYGQEIHKDLAVRLEHIATTGLSKESRKELTETYLIPSNGKLVGAPTLNAELKAALTEAVIKRDKAIETKQKVAAAAITSLGRAITHVLSKDKDTDLLRQLMDAGRLLCDCQYSDTLTRRNYILSSIKKEMKESLQNTKVDTYLFSEGLPDTLKAAKAINKSGAELKINFAPKPAPSTSKKPTPASSKNWRGYLARRPAPAAPPATTPKETTSSSTRAPRGGSSKHSHSQRAPRSRR